MLVTSPILSLKLAEAQTQFNCGNGQPEGLSKTIPLESIEKINLIKETDTFNTVNSKYYLAKPIENCKVYEQQSGPNMKIYIKIFGEEKYTSSFEMELKKKEAAKRTIWKVCTVIDLILAVEEIHVLGKTPVNIHPKNIVFAVDSDIGFFLPILTFIDLLVEKDGETEEENNEMRTYGTLAVLLVRMMNSHLDSTMLNSHAQLPVDIDCDTDEYSGMFTRAYCDNFQEAKASLASGNGGNLSGVLDQIRVALGIINTEYEKQYHAYAQLVEAKNQEYLLKKQEEDNKMFNISFGDSDSKKLNDKLVEMQGFLNNKEQPYSVYANLKLTAVRDKFGQESDAFNETLAEVKRVLENMNYLQYSDGVVRYIGEKRVI